MSATQFEPIALCPNGIPGPVRHGFAPQRKEHSSSHAASIKEVAVCLDGSELCGGVVTHARLVSQALGARLTLLRVLEAEGGAASDTIPADPLDWGIRQREAQAHLKQTAEQIDDPESSVRLHLIQGRPAEQICGWAENNDIDLTVLCSHGTHGLTEWDLASTARKLIDKIPGSFFLIPGQVAAKAEHARYRRILVPVDGSPRAESVIPIALRIAAAEDAELLLVHVVPTPEIIRLGLLDAEGRDLERRVIDHNQRVATAYLDRLRARVSQSGMPVRGLVVSGGSVRTKLEELVREERADLVVMSAHGQSGPGDAACGGVTEFAVTRAKVPILVLRERHGRRIRRVPASSHRSPERKPLSAPSVL